MCEGVRVYTVEPLLKDPIAKGRCNKYLSTGDSTLVTKIQFLMWNIVNIVPPNKDNLSIKDKRPEYIWWVPKCPLLGGSTVYD